MTGEAGTSLPIGYDRALDLLRDGELAIEGHVPWSSNATLLAELSDDDLTAYAIYKPQRGERPLWDFPQGTLCQRETAAFVVSRALGWDLVPPTVLRDGPWGLGAVQLFVPHDPETHYLAMPAPDRDAVRRIVALDVVINNADRKSGHVLLDEQEKLWAIDHGVTFHVQPKLRTVIWDHAGERLPHDLADDLSRFGDCLSDPADAVHGELAALLSSHEIETLWRRTCDLVEADRFPDADPNRRDFPWPPV